MSEEIKEIKVIPKVREKLDFWLRTLERKPKNKFTIDECNKWIKFYSKYEESYSNVFVEYYDELDEDERLEALLIEVPRIIFTSNVLSIYEDLSELEKNLVYTWGLLQAPLDLFIHGQGKLSKEQLEEAYKKALRGDQSINLLCHWRLLTEDQRAECFEAMVSYNLLSLSSMRFIIKHLGNALRNEEEVVRVIELATRNSVVFDDMLFRLELTDKQVSMIVSHLVMQFVHKIQNLEDEHCAPVTTRKDLESALCILKSRKKGNFGIEYIEGILADNRYIDYE